MRQIIEILTTFVLDTINAWGYAGVFILMALESANIPIPSEVIMPFAGFLAARGDLSLGSVIVIGALGNLFGSLVSYYLARYYGRRPLHFLARFYLVHENHELLAEKWFAKYGIISAFFARLLPIVRTFISYPAGMFKVNILKFSIFTFFGSLIWSAFLAYLGFVLGENWDILRVYFEKFDYVIAGLLAIAVIAWFWMGLRERQRE